MKNLLWHFSVILLATEPATEPAPSKNELSLTDYTFISTKKDHIHVRKILLKINKDVM